MDIKRYGPWALIVGGSEGIGSAFARKLAAKGFKLVLIARKPEPLRELEAELRSTTDVRTLSVDMSKPDAIDRLRTVTDDIEIGLLVYNAGANNTRGTFVELDPEVYRSVIGVNVIGQSECARHYGGLMRPRGRGGIILTGSLAGFMGAATLGPYCAAKAFSRILTETLWIECAPLGIDVLHLVIGATDTPAMRRLGMKVPTAAVPEDVAQEGLDNIANGPIWIAGGQGNRDIAVARSGVADRGELMRKFGTPRREQIAKISP